MSKKYIYFYTFFLDNIKNFDDYEIILPDMVKNSDIILFIRNLFLQKAFNKQDYFDKIKFLIKQINDKYKEKEDIVRFHFLFSTLLASGFLSYVNKNINNKKQFISDFLNIVDSELIRNSLNFYAYLFLNEFELALKFCQHKFIVMHENLLSALQISYRIFNNHLFTNSTTLQEYSDKEENYNDKYAHDHKIFFGRCFYEYSYNTYIITDSVVDEHYKIFEERLIFLLERRPEYSNKQIDAILTQGFSVLETNENTNNTRLSTIFKTLLSVINKQEISVVKINKFLQHIKSRKTDHALLKDFLSFIYLCLCDNFTKSYEWIMSNDVFIECVLSSETFNDPDFFDTFLNNFYGQRESYFQIIENAEEFCKIFVNSKLFQIIITNKVKLTTSLFDILFVALNPIIISLLDFNMSFDVFSYITQFLKVIENQSKNIKTHFFYFMTLVTNLYEFLGYGGYFYFLKKLIYLKSKDDFKHQFLNSSFFRIWKQIDLRNIIKNLPQSVDGDKDLFLILYDACKAFKTMRSSVSLDKINMTPLYYNLLKLAQNQDIIFLDKHKEFLIESLIELNNVNKVYSMSNNIIFPFLQNMRDITDMLSKLPDFNLIINKRMKQLFHIHIDDFNFLLFFIDNLELKQESLVIIKDLFSSLEYIDFQEDVLRNFEIIYNFITNNEVKILIDFMNYDKNITADFIYQLPGEFMQKVFFLITLFKNHLGLTDNNTITIADISEIRNEVNYNDVKYFINLLKEVDAETDFQRMLKNKLITFLRSELVVLNYLEKDENC